MFIYLLFIIIILIIPKPIVEEGEDCLTGHCAPSDLDKVDDLVIFEPIDLDGSLVGLDEVLEDEQELMKDDNGSAAAPAEDETENAGAYQAETESEQAETESYQAEAEPEQTEMKSEQAELGSGQAEEVTNRTQSESEQAEMETVLPEKKIKQAEMDANFAEKQRVAQEEVGYDEEEMSNHIEPL